MIIIQIQPKSALHQAQSQMAASTEEKLFKIFTEQFQVKRLMKQITDLKQLREKGVFDIKMSLLKECLVFKVEILPVAFKESRIQENLKIMQEVKFVVRKDYPAGPPRFFFLHDNMSKIGLKPFRDYMTELLAMVSGTWSAKVQIQQLIKSVPKFIEMLMTSASSKSILQTPKMPIVTEYFQIDNLFSWKFCQVHPIRLVKRNATQQGFLYVDIFTAEMVFLEDFGIENSYRICDFVQGSQIQTLRKKKNTSNHFILEVKLNYEGMTGKYIIEFYSQDQEAILIAVMDCSRVNENDRKMTDGQSKAQESSSEDEEQQQSEKKTTSISAEVPFSINQIMEEILIYESMVQNKMTTDNLSQLVTLLQKAIQYYSAASDERFKIYLNKMQAILSNEMAQALLESKHEQKQAEKKSMIKADSKQPYQSIVDLI